MNNAPLRIEQYETVLFNANLNPKGIPESVTQAIKENISSIVKYPDIYYNKLKKNLLYEKNFFALRHHIALKRLVSLSQTNKVPFSLVIISSILRI